MGKEKAGLKASTIILLILLLISAVFIILVETGAFKVYKNNNSIVKYDTIDEALNNIDFKVNIPKFILNNKDIECRVQNGSFLEIGCSKFVFKAASFIDFGADPLALYAKSKVDNAYSISDSDIEYFRIRLGNEEMPNCTIVNWVQKETSYGIIFSEIYNEDELLSIFDIDKNKLTEYYIEKETEASTNIQYTETLIANKFSVSIPKFETSFKTVDMEGYTICYIDNEKVFVFIYDDYNIDTNTFGGQSEVIINDKLVIRYISVNPFTEGTPAYNDYKTFIDTINTVINSIKYQ